MGLSSTPTPAQRRAFAMRTVWFEPGTSAYFNSAEYMTAKDWNGFKKAMAELGRALREPGLRRHLRQHRLDRRRALAPASELGRPDARSRRWPLRVVGLPEGRGAAPGLQPGDGLVRDRERDEHPGRISRSRAQGRLRVVGPVADHPHQGGPVVQGQDHAGGLDGPADRRLLGQRTAADQASGAAEPQ